MIRLVFVVCLVTSSDECREHTRLYANVSLFQCVLRAQEELAAWTETRPKWHIEKWTCKPHRPIERNG